MALHTLLPSSDGKIQGYLEGLLRIKRSGWVVSPDLFRGGYL